MHKIYESSASDAKAIVRLLAERNIRFTVGEDDGLGMPGSRSLLAIEVENADADALEEIAAQVRSGRRKNGVNIVRFSLAGLCLFNLLMVSVWGYSSSGGSSSREVVPILAVCFNSLLILVVVMYMKTIED